MILKYKSWEEMTVLEQYASQYWDMYKDAWGVRPRCIDTSGWTEAEFEAEFDLLNKIADANHEQMLVSQASAIKRFEAQVDSFIKSGAKDRNTAIRWFHEAEGTHGDNDYLCYTLGLPYCYIK
jgi:hypothetical protein